MEYSGGKVGTGDGRVVGNDGEGDDVKGGRAVVEDGAAEGVTTGDSGYGVSGVLEGVLVGSGAAAVDDCGDGDVALIVGGTAAGAGAGVGDDIAL